MASVGSRCSPHDQQHAQGRDRTPDEQPARLTGRVVGPAGQPLAGANLTAGPMTRATDTDGRFVLDGIDADAFDLRVEATGLASRLVPVDLAGEAHRDMIIELVAP